MMAAGLRGSGVLDRTIQLKQTVSTLSDEHNIESTMPKDPALAVTERMRRKASSHHKTAGANDFSSSVAWILNDLEKDSKFFEKNPPRSLPYFKSSEVIIGDLLGEGEFGIIKELKKFNVKDKCTCSTCVPPPPTEKAPEPPTQIVFEGPLPTPEPVVEGHKRLESVGSRVSFAMDATLGDDDEEWLVNEDHEVADEEGAKADRGYMAEHFMRDGKARYACKQLKDDIPRKMMLDAAIDLASEAKFLASLRHPNILKLRGTVGTPGHPNFCLILDRLHSTLVDTMSAWKVSEKRFRGFLGRIGVHKEELEQVRNERLVALFDIARAMKFLHEHKIVFRDIKPENIGFDVRGDAKLFDFGLAKELLPRDLVTPPDSYQATGITGSRRYMAPEVLTCKDYGLSADVFGFGILLWEVMSLKVPFENFDADKHFTHVVVKEKRPKDIPWLSRSLHAMMEECWSATPGDRPSFKSICEALRAHLSAVELGFGRGTLTNRSKHLLDISWTSRYGAYRSGRDRSSSSGSAKEDL